MAETTVSTSTDQPATTAPPAFAIPKEFRDKIVVDGKEREVSYEEMKAGYQKGIGAEERFKYANTVLEAIKKNPMGVLMNPAMGVDMKKVAFETLQKSNLTDDDKKELSQWFYEKIVKPAQMSPEERERLQYKTEAEQLRAEKKEREEAEATTKQEAATKQEFQRILAEISAEIPTSGLPFTPDLKSPNDADLVRRIGKKMEIAIRANRLLSVKEAVALVKVDLRSEHNAMAKLYNEDNLHEFYDSDVMEKFNRAMLKKFKTSEKEKEKAERAKASENEPRYEPRGDRAKGREAAKNADKLMRKISQGRF